MKILFIHQNYPGQFKHLAPALAAQPGNRVVVLTIRDVPPQPGIQIVRYRVARSSSPNIHPWAVSTETKIIRGEAAFHAALRLRKGGFMPDVIFAHPGWGESLFLKDVWPDARLLIYCEFFYRPEGADFNFDPEFRRNDLGEHCRIRVNNANHLLHMDACDWAISPTHWQRATHPPSFQPRISVIHDGIDTGHVRPDPEVAVEIAGRRFTRADEVVTFVNRNLEPYRGYHIFMRALPEILARRPNAHVVIVGSEGHSYGAKPAGDLSYKQRFLNEVRGRIDPSRVHFTGSVDYDLFLRLMQLSSVHVYLTYPFVLSWSMIEAMVAGACVVASRTAPVVEAIEDGRTGLLVDFFDKAALAEAVVGALADPGRRAALGAAARDFAIARYDLRRVCLPRQLDLLENLAAGREPPAPPLPPVDYRDFLARVAELRDAAA